MDGQPHVPVMLKEALAILAPRPGGRFLDLTLGGGGHTRAILEAVGPEGFVLGIDRDPELADETRERLRAEGFDERRFRAVCGNFADLERLVGPDGVGWFDGILADLGANSAHFDRPERGFSFGAPGPLDMRYDRQGGGRTLKDWLGEVDEAGLRRVLRDYGEERYATRIARALLGARDAGRLTDTLALAETIRQAYPPAARHASRIDPATRACQALRIAVNDELGSARRGLIAAANGMRAGARLAVISFHSLEDRLVKRLIRSISEGAQDFYGKRGAAAARDLTRKPVTPSEQETMANPRARSAKLRAMEKLRDGPVIDPETRWAQTGEDLPEKESDRTWPRR